MFCHVLLIFYGDGVWVGSNRKIRLSSKVKAAQANSIVDYGRKKAASMWV
jgi:hypothetical protein